MNEHHDAQARPSIDQLVDLVARLRGYYTEDDERFHIDHPICDEAAGAIETLLAAVKSCEEALRNRPNLDELAKLGREKK